MGKTVFMFPGQGSQSVGMGKDLFLRYSKTSEIFAAANEILGFDLKDLCLSGPEERLNETRNTQAAMFVVNHIADYLLKEKGVTPDIVMGHSLGEYNALVSAGVVSFEAALWLVKTRADLMHKVASETKGKMIAVLGLDDETVTDIANTRGVYVANYNCPGQIVVSGEKDKIDSAVSVFQQAGARKVVELKVSGAFHSPLMRNAAESLDQYLQEAHFKEVSVPVVSNFTGSASTNDQVIKTALKKQMTGPVRWSASVETALEEGATDFIEAGPGRVLAGLVKRIAAEAGHGDVMILNVEDY